MMLWVIVLLSAGLVGLGLFMIFNSFTVMKINLNAFYDESYQNLRIPTILALKPVLLYLATYVIVVMLTQHNTTVLDSATYHKLDNIFEAGRYLWIFALVMLVYNALTGEVNIKLMGEKKFKRIQSLFIGFIIGFFITWILPALVMGAMITVQIFA